MMPTEPRIVEAPGMLLAGIRRNHKMSSAAQTIPQQWAEFRDSGIRDQRAQRAFGVICGTSGDDFEYMTAVEVASFDDVGPGFGRMRVPAQKYAVFTHDGHISQLGETWRAIREEWLPSSKYEDGETPAFEIYDQRFDVERGQGGIEIWFPIAER